MITKEECKEFVYTLPNFPIRNDWIVANGYPCSASSIYKLFGAYSNFKDYCNKSLTKEDCKEFALKVKEETGKFPVSENWIVNNGYPCSYDSIRKLFKTYNNFRDYCGEPHIVRTEEISLEWLKSKCIIDDNDCWNWGKSLQNGLYGSTRNKGRTQSTHVLSYTLKNGNIPKDFVVRHICNNKTCCNPDHLKLGTHRDNQLDSRCYRKGVKLTEDNIKSIKQDMLKQDFSIRGNKNNFDKKWSKQFNVSIRSISYVRINKTWKDIII